MSQVSLVMQLANCFLYVLIQTTTLIPLSPYIRVLMDELESFMSPLGK